MRSQFDFHWMSIGDFWRRAPAVWPQSLFLIMDAYKMNFMQIQFYYYSTRWLLLWSSNAWWTSWGRPRWVDSNRVESVPACKPWELLCLCCVKWVSGGRLLQVKRNTPCGSGWKYVCEGSITSLWADVSGSTPSCYLITSRVLDMSVLRWCVKHIRTWLISRKTSRCAQSWQSDTFRLVPSKLRWNVIGKMTT